MSKIKKITHPFPVEIVQARIDEAIVTGKAQTEKPFWYENTENNQCYYDLCGCVGWPSDVTEKDDGMPGYIAIVAVVKMGENSSPRDAPFQLLAEYESKDVPSLLRQMLKLREEWGFGLHPDLLQAWTGTPDRFISTIALLNEGLRERGGERQAILISPPDDYDDPKAFDNYVRSLQSCVTPDNVRFYFGGNDILRNKLIGEFKRDNPAVLAVGGLVHSLLLRCEWLDQQRENAFVVEEVNLTTGKPDVYVKY